MKKISFLLVLCSALLIFSCASDDEMDPQPTNCPEDVSFGDVNIDDNTITFISEEMRDSTIIIFEDENGAEMAFNVSDGNMGQDYLKTLAEQNRSISCGSETVQATLTPQEFFLTIESDDQRFSITWRVTVESSYDAATNSIKLTDQLSVVASGNVDGIMNFTNDKADPTEGPVQNGGGFYQELRIHGIPFKDVYLDQPAVDGTIDAANIALNQDFGIAAFKDRMGFWWRHKDFR